VWRNLIANLSDCEVQVLQIKLGVLSSGAFWRGLESASLSPEAPWGGRARFQRLSALSRIFTGAP
jgi:hypothetical protein